MAFTPYNKRTEIVVNEFYKPFALAFNQDAPDTLAPSLEMLCTLANERGYLVRLGGNKGIEEYVEDKMQRKEVHLPWRNFNEKDSKLTFNTQSAFTLSKQFSPVYDRFPDAVKAMLARNVRLVLGKNLNSPLLFLVTWTRDGCESGKERSVKTGNVGHVISMADMLRVPIFNLARPDAMDRLKRYFGDIFQPTIEAPNVREPNRTNPDPF